MANLSYAAMGEQPIEPVFIIDPEIQPSLSLLAEAGYFEIERQEASNEGTIRWLGNDVPNTLEPVQLGIGPMVSSTWVPSRGSHQFARIDRIHQWPNRPIHKYLHRQTGPDCFGRQRID